MCYPFIIALNVAGAFRKKRMTIMSRASSTINRDLRRQEKKISFMEREKKYTILGAPEKQVLFWSAYWGCKALCFFFVVATIHFFGTCGGRSGTTTAFSFAPASILASTLPPFRRKIVSKGLSVLA